MPRLPLTALVLVLCLATISSPPPRSQIELLSTMPASKRATLIEGAMVVFDDPWVVLFEPDGQERWRAHLPPGGSDDLMEYGELLLIQRFEDRFAYAMTTLALDLQTGDRRWELDGYVHPAEGHLIQWREDGFRVYDSQAERVIWETSRQRAVNYDPATRSVYVLTDDGRLVEHAFPTGEVRRSRQLQVPEQAKFAHVGIAYDYVFVAFMTGEEHGEQTEEQFFFDRESLEPTAAAHDAWHDVRECGVVLCAISIEGSYEILDRDTRQVLWRSSAGDSAAAAGVGDDLLILTYRDGPEVRLVEGWVDSRTGRPRGEVAGWHVVMDLRTDLPTPIWLKRSEPAHTVIAWFGPDGPQIFGRVPAELLSCRFKQPLLQCRTNDLSFATYRVTPPG